ncbi:hypothetical protein, partial [Actinomyces trachealis]|uniref:hypothetical protein n=1 Tax=Actinomyces trachealis TaxID=2763540 RepID=UPI001C554643
REASKTKKQDNQPPEPKSPKNQPSHHDIKNMTHYRALKQHTHRNNHHHFPQQRSFPEAPDEL